MELKGNMCFLKGLKDGIPVALGYLSVGFGFGILAAAAGLSPLVAFAISATNLTSAGQVAGVGVIAAMGTYIEMALTQLVINIRYSLMGLSLSQKLAPSFNTPHRLMVSYGITDEIFAVAASKPYPVGPSYFYGLMTCPYVGWSLGTLLGAVAGQLLPADLQLALGIMIYAMFIAIIIPPACKSRGVLGTILISVGMSCCLEYIPFFSFISDGFSIIICALTAACVMALLCPVKDEEEGVDGEEVENRDA